MSWVDLIDFWFSPQAQPYWFERSDEFDQKIRQRFQPLLENRGVQDLESWMERPESALALVLLWDQVPRNSYRGSPKAYSFDAQARGAAKVILERGWDKGYDQEQKLFAYLPFEHSEDLADQRLSMEMMGALEDPKYHFYAKLHYDIVERFGRFPHRNETLGRESSVEELDFLKGPNSSF